MIRCIVFDFDGTLVESNEIKRRAYYDVVIRFEGSTTVVDEVLTTSRGKNRYAVFAEIVARLSCQGGSVGDSGNAPSVDQLVNAYSRVCEREIAVCPEIDGATETLGKLRDAGYRLYVNSATPTRHLERLLDLRGLSRYFDGALGSDKTKLENLLSIMDREAVSGPSIVMVGDGDDDEEASRQAGCHFVRVARRRLDGMMALDRNSGIVSLRQLEGVLGSFASAAAVNGAAPGQLDD